MMRFPLMAFLLLGLAFSFSKALGGPMGYPDGTVTTTKLTVEEITLLNTTLLGEKVAAKQVVCRTRWGTPMLPNGKGGYSVIQRINLDYIKESNIIPPITDGPVYHVRPTTEKVIIVPAGAIPAK